MLYSVHMGEIAITEARAQLSSLVDRARHEPIYLTRRNQPVAALVDAERLAQLLGDAEELADIRATEAAWAETAALSETPIPWDEVRHDLGLA